MRQHGPLTTPDDLQRHNCLLYSHFASQHWQFSDAQGREASVAVNGNLSAGISSLLLEAAVAGCGIAMLPELEARARLPAARWRWCFGVDAEGVERLRHLSFPRLPTRWITAIS
jgi:DNA-binding transcriptional LysR family regulator